MSHRKAVVWRDVVEELANALQVAIGFAAEVHRNARTSVDDAARLERAISRAVSVLKQAQPPTPRKRGRR